MRRREAQGVPLEHGDGDCKHHVQWRNKIVLRKYLGLFEKDGF